MEQHFVSIQILLREVSDHLKSGTKTDRKTAATKLKRISEITSTLALTIDARKY